MALIYCNQCGRQVSDRAKACPHCGAPVVVMGGIIDDQIIRPMKRPHESMSPPVAPPETPQESKNTTGKVVLAMLIPTIAALLLIAVLVGGGCWLYSRYSDESHFPSTEQASYESEPIDTIDSSITPTPVDSAVAIVADSIKAALFDAASYYMDGYIAGVKVEGMLYRDGSKLYGLYGYKSRSDGVVLEGTIEYDNTVTFYEYDYERGKQTGSFYGTIKQFDDGGQRISGNFTNDKGSSYRASLDLVHCEDESVPSSVISRLQDTKSRNESRYSYDDSYSYSSSSSDNSVLCTVVGRSNARYGPGSEYSVAYELDDGQLVRVVAKSGNWYKLENGYWTHRQNLRRY